MFLFEVMSGAKGAGTYYLQTLHPEDVVAAVDRCVLGTRGDLV